MAKKRQVQVLVEWVDPTARGGIDAKATITPEGIRVAAKMCRAGHPQHGIAATMGLGRESFRSAIERQPELQRALDISLGALEQECVSVLVEAMRKGQYSAAMFLLKGKFGFREAGVVEQPTGATQINIVIPPRMTDEEYQKVIRDITPPAEETESAVIEGVVVQKRITR